MTPKTSTNIGCLLVGEYVDEGEVPETFAHLRNRSSPSSQVERPRVVASYLDLWSKETADREFTVLLCDNRTVTVRGHAIKLVEAASAAATSYAVLMRAAGTEVIVGLFRADQVTGIFSGEMRRTKESA